MSHASKGRAFEHEIRELFRSAGYSVVRGAGSKGTWRGQKVDLVFSKDTEQTNYTAVVMGGIQCKVKRLKRTEP